jgi:hypothetical protein
LSHSAQRGDGAATLLVTEKAAQKLAAILIEKGLAREVRAKAGMPVWRRNDDGRACALVITKSGREAIKGGGDSRYMTPEVRQQLTGRLERINAANAAAGLPPFAYKTIPQGAATSVWAGVVASADEVGGRYREDCHVAERGRTSIKHG